MPSGDAPHPLAIGGQFALGGSAYTLDSYFNLTHVLAKRDGADVREKLAIADILAAIQQPAVVSGAGTEESTSSGTETLSEKDWAEAERREAKLKLIIEAIRPSKALVKEIAEALGKSVATIYRWRIVHAKKGIVGLAPHHPTGGRGKSRLVDLQEDIVDEAIEEHYLTTKKLKIPKVMEVIEERCHRAKLKIPHPNTVRLRVAWLSDKKKAAAREGRKGARRHKAYPGIYDEAIHPNAVWQIDHTPLDVCIVDDVYRKNIGRVWLTLAIDVFSRVVAGFYMSIDKPNATSVGMALVHAILPKEAWLAAHGIDMAWPVWGKPLTVHADNDRTFRCDPVTRAAKAQKINLEWRPVATPNWGGHIERLLGTVNQEIQTINGTTFSNPMQRGEYKPHEEAEFTFDQTEEYLTRWLCGVYHQRKHTGLNRPPIRKYESGILGDAESPGVGLPEPITDPLRLKLDFMPCTTKTVQNNGVTWDSITYYDPAIDKYIHARDPENRKVKRKFLLRRDPRDLSFIWFLDPERDVYIKIPYRRMEHPSITLWELRAVRKFLREAGRSEVDEEVIFDTYRELQKIKSKASQETQAARKEAQKKKMYAKKSKTEKAQMDGANPGKPSATEQAQEQKRGPVGVLLDEDSIVALAIE
ncbi:MAG TPA: Mu transposase C-terminal domain-containing protein [Arenimonas sp.]|uniref:Mu transposase C-terminal domain-containing protein n=1 Tax=Arenimonas sp. TaxID=1872635 RepID=UPI002D7FC635|nr:Mu transposase C-terminal domain-containing protein [Arenimonas sp.]HEU0153150.1 Mu transposase C-terminal domain-containing protein [Arenimonas sp.]